MDNRDQRIGNWERFIILEDNKASLAHFLSTEISESYSASWARAGDQWRLQGYTEGVVI